MAIFDNEAEIYNKWYTMPLGKFVDEVETRAIMELLSPQSGEKILDVGCGTGNYSIKIARLGANVIGIDCSEPMLKIARKKAESLNLNIEFILADAMNLPFEENFFDACLSVTAVEFFADQTRGLEEMFRVVRPNGKIVVGFLNRDSAWGELYTSEEFRKNTVFRFANLLSIEEIKKIKTDSLVEVRQSLFIPPNATENLLNWEEENKLNKINKGGFVVALWRKK
ncbi:MAG: class I SAM-dependent methyltransferase [Candidatus Kapaibacteriales bacterium]